MSTDSTERCSYLPIYPGRRRIPELSWAVLVSHCRTPNTVVYKERTTPGINSRVDFLQERGGHAQRKLWPQRDFVGTFTWKHRSRFALSPFPIKSAWKDVASEEGVFYLNRNLPGPRLELLLAPPVESGLAFVVLQNATCVISEVRIPG